MKNKKLLISIGTLSHGGAERVISILTKSFVEEFKEVEILMWFDRPVYYDIDKRITLVCLPRLSGTSNRYKNMYYFRKYIKKSNPDVILSFLTPFNMLILLSLIGLKSRIIVCERNDPHFVPGGKIMEFVRNNLYRLAEGALVQTNYGLSCYPSYIRNKMKVIYNPIVMQDNLVGKAACITKENIFVSVGRLDPQKNHRMLLKAFHSFHQKYPDYQLIIYGDGPIRKQTEELVRTLNLQNVVSLPGNCKDVWTKMLKAKAFLLSSNAEGMSNALIEALCLGLPAISTKVSGSTDLIKDGFNGFLVDLNDVETFTLKMEYFALNEKASVEMGKSASSLYEQLNYEYISKQWIEYLNKVLVG